jgi:lactoylglutathione lyase
MARESSAAGNLNPESLTTLENAMTKCLHTMIRVTDPEATIRFFELIGLKEVRRMENEKGRYTLNRPPRDGHMAFVRTPDGISIELLQEGTLPPREPWASMPNTGTW